MEQRRFPKAETLLTRSLTFFNLSGEPGQAAEAMLTLGTLYYYQSEYGCAAEVTRRALDL